MTYLLGDGKVIPDAGLDELPGVWAKSLRAPSEQGTEKQLADHVCDVLKD